MLTVFTFISSLNALIMVHITSVNFNLQSSLLFLMFNSNLCIQELIKILAI
jgi:hypothetical protein